MGQKKEVDKKNVAIYCRVSTYEQGKGEFSSLKSQEDTLRHYCRSKGWTIYNVYTDTKTGTTLERNGLTLLLKDAEEGKFNIVAITKLDRISRSIKDFLELNEVFQTLNVDLVVTTQLIDTTSAQGRMQRNIILAFAEFERDLIADRTREKLYSQAQQGIWNGGFLRLGYDQGEKKLMVNEDEANLVRRIFKYYLEEPSAYKVATRLNKEGFKTKIRKNKKGIISGGGAFDGAHVARIIKSKFYIGKITFKGEEFQGLHQPIIDDDTFSQAQKEMGKNRANAMTTYDASELLLLGLTKCGFCGGFLTTSFGNSNTGERYYYYKCTKKLKFGSAKCEAGDIPADKLESLVEKIIVHIGEDSDFFNAVFKQISVNDDEEVKVLKSKLIDLKKNLVGIERQLNKLTDFVAQSIEDIPVKTIQDRLVLLSNEKTSVEEAVSATERDIEVISTYDISKERLQKRYSELSRIYVTLSIEKKRKLAKAMIAGIECFMKKKEAKGKLKFSFRGDGVVEMEWDKKENAETQISSFGTPWLRGTIRSSKKFTLILPIFFHRSKHGEKILAVDPNEVRNYLDLDNEGVARLTRHFLYPAPRPDRLRRVKLDRIALAKQYRELIDSGLVSNQSELARHLGVSRVWITKIMNSLKTKSLVTS
jgi:site-specific DNA recombinase